MRIKFLDYNLDNLSLNETIDRIISIIDSGRKCHHVVLNASKIVLMKKDIYLANIINSCDLINADGVAILVASMLFGNKIKERITGIDLMSRLLDVSEIKGYRIYLLGAEEVVISSVVKEIKKKYKELEIVGYRNGFFRDDEELSIVNEINNSKPHILFVGISSPKKEYFLYKYKDKLNVPFCMGVGGSFDIFAGKYKRAPNWMQKIGFEWVYRFVQEPRRMFKRYFFGNFLFLFYVLKFKLLKR